MTQNKENLVQSTGKFKDIKNDKFKNTVSAYIDDFYSTQVGDSQITTSNNIVRFKDNSYSNIVLQAACQAYKQGEDKQWFLKGEWNAAQEYYTQLLCSQLGLEVLEDKVYYNIREIYYNVKMLNLPSVQIEANSLANSSILNPSDNNKVKQVVGHMLLDGNYKQEYLHSWGYNNENIDAKYKNNLLDSVAYGAYEVMWNIWNSIVNTNESNTYDYLQAQKDWTTKLQTFSDTSTTYNYIQRGLVVPDNQNASAHDYGYLNLAVVFWWLDKYANFTNNELPIFFEGLKKTENKKNPYTNQSSSIPLQNNQAKKYSTLEYTSNSLTEFTNTNSKSNSEKPLFLRDSKEILGYLRQIFKKEIPLVINFNQIENSIKTKMFDYWSKELNILKPYEELGKIQVKSYETTWQSKVSEAASKYSLTLLDFPDLYQTENGEIIYDQNNKPLYTFLIMNSKAEAASSLQNSSGWIYEYTETPEQQPEDSESTKEEQNNNEVAENKEMTSTNRKFKIIEFAKDKITYTVSGLDTNYTANDRRIWLAIYETKTGKLVYEEYGYQKPLEIAGGVTILQGGTETGKTLYDKTVIECKLENKGVQLDLSQQYTIVCKIAYSSRGPYIAEQNYGNLDGKVAEGWTWLYSKNTHINSETVTPIFTEEELLNKRFYVGKPPKDCENYMCGKGEGTFDNDITIIYTEVKNNIDEFLKRYRALCMTNEHIRLYLHYYPMVSGYIVYKWLQENRKVYNEMTYVYNKQYFGLVELGNVVDLTPIEKSSSSIPDIEIEKQPTIDYTDWGKVSTDTIISAGSTQYKMLFPPIVESYQPAFDATSALTYKIEFKLSNYTDISEVGHVGLRLIKQSDNSSAISASKWIDEIVYFRKDEIYSKADGSGYYINISVADDLKIKAWETNTYYKVQLRLGVDSIMWNKEAANGEAQYKEWRDEQIMKGKFSEWSTVMLIKPISKPTVEILNASFSNQISSGLSKLMHFVPVEFTSSPRFYGHYSLDVGDTGILEELDYYKYQLYLLNENGEYELIEDSGLQKYINDNVNFLNSNSNELSYFLETQNIYENTSNGITSWCFKHALLPNSYYKVVFAVQTTNYFTKEVEYEFQVAHTQIDYFGFMEDERLTAIPNEEEGIIELKLFSGYQIYNQVLNLNDISGNFVITRSEAGSNQWEDLKHFSISPPRNYNDELIFTDYTAESGIIYKYGIQKEYSSGVRSNRLESGEVEVNYEHSYLLGENKQLKIKFDPKISSFKHTILAAKQDTLGGKYPLILRNGQSYYAEFQIDGLITLHSDENHHFMSLEIDGLYYNDENIISRSKFTQNVNSIQSFARKQRSSIRGEIGGQAELENNLIFDTNTTNNNIYIERKFREKAEEFLNNGKPKLFKSPTEGNILVSLMNVSLTPKQELGRMIYSFSATAYEIGENSISNLQKYDIVSPSQFNTVISSGYLCGQLHGLIEGNIIELIRKDLEKRNSDDVQIVPIAIKELRIEHYPKTYFTHRLAELEKKIYELTYNTNHKIPSYQIEEQLVELTKEKTELLNMEWAFLAKDQYPPFKLQTPDIKNKDNGIVILSDKPYVLSELNWSFEEKAYLRSLDVYSSGNTIVSLTTPAIINYVVEVSYHEPTIIQATQGSRYCGMNSIQGYFVDPNSSRANMFAYTTHKKLIKRANQISIGNSIYYNSKDVIEVILSQIENSLKDKMNNTEDNYSLERVYDLDGISTIQPTWVYIDNTHNRRYLIEFSNIKDLEFETSPGTTLIFNKSENNKGQRVTVGDTGIYRLSPTEISLINENKSIEIDLENNLAVTYINLRYVYELNVMLITEEVID